MWTLKCSKAASSTAISPLAALTLASCFVVMNWGIIAAARMPITATTTMISISVKPPDSHLKLRVFIFTFLRAIAGRLRRSMRPRFQATGAFWSLVNCPAHPENRQQDGDYHKTDHRTHDQDQQRRQ